MIIRFIFFIAAVTLYLLSPNEYDFKFCLWCTLLYLFEVVLFIRQEVRQGMFLSSNLISFFSFFCTRFAYPVLVYDTPAGDLGVLSSNIDWSVLSHTTSLCLVFASSYILGYGSASFKIIDKTDTFRTTHGKSDQIFTIVFIVLICMAFLYLVRARFSYTDFAFDVAFWDLYFVLLAFCLIEKSKFKSNDCGLKEFFLYNKFTSFSAIFIIIVFLIFGDRGPALKTLLVCGAIYNYYYRNIHSFRIVLICSLGLALMFLIRQTRGDMDFLTVLLNPDLISQVFDLGDDALFIFSDLYGASMELNIAYDYAQHHALFHPERVLFIPFTAVPFLPSIVLGFFGTSMDIFATGAVLNRVMAAYNPHFGNHVVGDLYMSTGFIGVIIFALVLGLISKKLVVNRYTNEMYAVAYIMLFSFALYLPRDSVFTLVRPISLSFIVLYFLLPKRKLV